jgi:hypothetical protein
MHDGEEDHRRRRAHEEGDNPLLKVIQNFIHGISPDPCSKKRPSAICPDGRSQSDFDYILAGSKPVSL